MEVDVVVIGAGAAGLIAAERAASAGRRVVLLEKNRKPGVKILMSGGTRCNLTHATDRQGIVRAYGSQGKFLHSALAALSPQQLVALIEAEGVPTKVETTGKVFPVSNRAADVLRALMARLNRSGAEISLSESVIGLQRLPDGPFEVQTDRRTLVAAKVILTTGGQSYPGSGTTGDGYAWAQAMGHTIVPPRPALVPITTSVAWVRELQGVTTPDIALRLVEPGPPARELDRRRGSLLFAHFGLSGPVALDISRHVSGHPQPATLRLECDFLPDVPTQQLDEQFRTAAGQTGRKTLASLAPAEVPGRLFETLLNLAGLDAAGRGAELSRAGRAALVKQLKTAEIPVAGTRGFAKAEVTAGGVALAEVDSRTMESKLAPGLYLAGEVLDLDGPIGGYNFQAAFSTGWLAGESV